MQRLVKAPFAPTDADRDEPEPLNNKDNFVE